MAWYRHCHVKAHCPDLGSNTRALSPRQYGLSLFEMWLECFYCLLHFKLDPKNLNS